MRPIDIKTLENYTALLMSKRWPDDKAYWIATLLVCVNHTAWRLVLADLSIEGIRNIDGKFNA